MNVQIINDCDVRLNTGSVSLYAGEIYILHSVDTDGVYIYIIIDNHFGGHDIGKIEIKNTMPID